MNINKSNYLRIAVIFFILASFLPVMTIMSTTVAPNFAPIAIAAATEEGGIEYRDEDGNLVEREVDDGTNELAREAEDGYEAIMPLDTELGDDGHEAIEPIAAELATEAGDTSEETTPAAEDTSEETTPAADEPASFAPEVLIVLAALVVAGGLAFFLASRKPKDKPQMGL